MLHFPWNRGKTQLNLCTAMHFLEDKVLLTDAYSARKIALQAPLFTILDGILIRSRFAREEQLYLTI